MKLSFLGAAREVTGSCVLVETADCRFLVDCGMFQGTKTIRELNYRPFPVDPRGIDHLLLTHAHIDHGGLIPKLAKHGFDGGIHATEPTLDLLKFMLPDSGHIQEFEVQRLNERNRRRGQPQVEPIYTRADAEACLRLGRDYLRALQEFPEFTGFILRSIAVPSPDSGFRDLMPLVEKGLSPIGLFIHTAFGCDFEQARKEMMLYTGIFNALVEEKLRRPDYEAGDAEADWATRRWLRGLEAGSR